MSLRESEVSKRERGKRRSRGNTLFDSCCSAFSASHCCSTPVPVLLHDPSWKSTRCCWRVQDRTTKEGWESRVCVGFPEGLEGPLGPEVLLGVGRATMEERERGERERRRREKGLAEGRKKRRLVSSAKGGSRARGRRLRGREVRLVGSALGGAREE